MYNRGTWNCSFTLDILYKKMNRNKNPNHCKTNIYSLFCKTFLITITIVIKCDLQLIYIYIFF